MIRLFESVVAEENRMNITAISSMKNKFEEFMECYQQNCADVVLYGAGRGADWTIDLLQTKNIKPAALVDKKLRGGGKRDIPIISFEELVDRYQDKNRYILITTPKFEEEVFQLLREYFPAGNIFAFESELYYHYIDNVSVYRSYILSKEAEFNELYHKLSDDISRRTLEYVLRGRVSGEWSYFRDVYVGNQYFADGIVELGQQEIFLDIGAFIGDTAEYIVKMTGGSYSKIYCFEPDKKCLDSLRKNTEKYENIEIIEKGAWNKYEKLLFQEDSERGASSIGNNTGYEIEVDCVDNCIDENVCVTHIKMDIEGAELKALQGAKRTIQRHKPKLAICVYHKNEDLLNISNYILSIVPEYRLYLRHHNISGTETVLYAICG